MHALFVARSRTLILRAVSDVQKAVKSARFVNTWCAATKDARRKESIRKEGNLRIEAAVTAVISPFAFERWRKDGGRNF